MFVYITRLSEKCFSAEIFAYWQCGKKFQKCVYVFFFNLGWRYHIKYKTQTEMLHNTEKHKNNNNMVEFQNWFVHLAVCTFTIKSVNYGSDY